ncbi:MAG: sugar ABC transporter ATP-binding protein [Phycisphaerales bacterium]|nr:sugar ABC transporter ATP-binding protein [Phycisphaerales bacterium]
MPAASPDALAANTRAVLRVRDVGHRYDGVAALAGITLEVRSGEVLAIVGENGAGKSTLLKILSGVLEHSEGELETADASGAWSACRMQSVRDAARAGIALVHQELNLSENLDVAGCIFLGREPSRFGMLQLAAMHREAKHWLACVGLAIDPSTLCESLSIAQRQLIEIAKALSTEARVLILDEPTSSLSAHETARLLALLRTLRANGVAILFVSHHLDEVLALADRVVVLRDGKQTGELLRSACDRAKLEQLMVGREIVAAPPRPQRTDAAVRLRVRDLVSAHAKRQPVSLEVRAGEIVGLAGLVGAGRTEVLEAIAGITESRGYAMLDGKLLRGGAAHRVRSGVALVPEDRARNGLFLENSLAMNLSLAWIDQHRAAGLVRTSGECALVDRMISRMQVRPAAPHRRVRTLSGGNQQKSVIGRFLAISPKLLLLDEPTRGVDVGARAEIHAQIRQLADTGSAVLFASSELEEVLLLADRILVMHEGRIVGEFAARAATEIAIMQLATGGGCEAASMERASL